MFSKLVANNSKRNRRDNGLYFGAMILSIIAFYIILSLSHQDVMIFLKTMESDAISRLLSIIPVFYVASLYFLFFLVYFASSIQIERRSHEFGVYLALGMKRHKLVIMLLLEDLRTNIIALGIGLPLAIILSELVSLVTAKLIGLGIIGHKFSLSWMAVIFTIFGFLCVKSLAIVILSATTANRNIDKLLGYKPKEIRKQLPRAIYLLSLIIGILMLIKAYLLGISGQAWMDFYGMGLAIFLGFTGMILLFFGIRYVIDYAAKIGSRRKLHAYNARQIHELVIMRSTSLAICTLLIFLAICLFSAGVSIAIIHSNSVSHVLDYTFSNANSYDNLSIESVKTELKNHQMNNRFSKILQIKVGAPKKNCALDIDSLINAIDGKQTNETITILRNKLAKRKDFYLISLNGYNDLLQASGKAPIQLEQNEVCLYMHEEFVIDRMLLNDIIKDRPGINFLGNDFTLTGQLESTPIITDRAITLAFAFIVADDQFDLYTDGEYSSYISGILNPKQVEDEGLMMAILNTNEKLKHTSLGYESYINTMGRQLFYIVSASYITIYLAVIFLIIANTIIGVQFLMGQMRSYKRYQILIHLGATYDVLCQSSAKQINWYFGLPIFIAIINSYFGIQVLLTGILSPSAKTAFNQQMLVAGGMIIFLALVEFIYMTLVKKSSNTFLLTLMKPLQQD